MSSELDYELYNENTSYKKKEEERRKYYSIRSPVTGILSRVLVKEGDHVKGGQIVVLLECMKTFVEVRVPEYMKDGEVVWVIKCCYDKSRVVRQNEELVRIKEED